MLVATKKATCSSTSCGIMSRGGIVVVEEQVRLWQVMRRFHAGFMCGSRCWLQSQPTVPALPLGSGSLGFYCTCLQPYHSIISLRIVRWCSVHILHNYIPDQLLIALLIARDYHRNFEIISFHLSLPSSHNVRGSCQAE